MTLELRVLSGARAGQRERFDKSVISIGRHPLSDLRFDPEADRDVSARHAEIRIVEGRLTLRDTQSTNGTFVNGQRVSGERELRPGDVLSFGEQGPKVEIRELASGTAPAPAEPPRATATAAAARPVAARPAAAAPAAPAPRAPAPASAHRTTGERIALAVHEHTRPLRLALGGLAVLLVAGVGGAYWLGHRDAAARTAELDELLRRSTAMSAEYARQLDRVSGTVNGLDSALAAAKQDGDALRGQMQQARASDPKGAKVSEYSARLAQAQTRQQRLVSAATMDASTVAAANGAATALIAVQTADGRAFSGTGFSISPSGLLVTNRHLMQDERGQPVQKTMVIFSDTRQWIPAHLVKSSTRDDLAFLQLDAGGSWPTVRGVAASAEAAPAVGAPVVIIGYPLGTATAGMAGDISQITARSTLGVGTVSKRLPDVLQIDAYAGEGSSGSPVFDAQGRVVGVVYGGATESGGRIVYAVPAARLAEELPR